MINQVNRKTTSEAQGLFILTSPVQCFVGHRAAEERGMGGLLLWSSGKDHARLKDDNFVNKNQDKHYFRY